MLAVTRFPLPGRSENAAAQLEQFAAQVTAKGTICSVRHSSGRRTPEGELDTVMTPGELRARAEECDRLAAKTIDRSIASEYRDLARQWRDLAEQVEQLRKPAELTRQWS